MEIYDERVGGSTLWGSGTARSPFSLPGPENPTRVLSIGVLRGSWREMGRQYGERAESDIAQHWDVDWQDRVIGCSGVWAVSRTVEDRQRYRLAYLERSWRELQALSPELCEFMVGVGEGSASALSESGFASAAPDHLKVLFLNESDAALHPAWDFDADRPGAGARSAPGADDYVNDHDNQGDGCNGYWVSAAGTTNGHAIAQRAVQAGMNRTVTAVSYVAIPDDPAASVFWGIGRAGCLGGLGAVMNEHGVCALTSGSQGGDVDRSLAPGVKDFILAAYGVIFARTAQGAQQLATVGHEEYRRKTGRATVLRFRGANIMFCDPGRAYVVESNARYFGVRASGAGGAGEPDILVMANHFVGDTAIDENGDVDSGFTMRAFEPGRSGSVTRYWTGQWWLRNNYGKVGVPGARLFAGSHGVYDEDGSFFDVDPDSGRQRAREETWCAHRWEDGQEHLPLGSDGNNITTVFDLSSREVWFCTGWTCHFTQWRLEWNYLNLNDYRR